MRKIKWQDKQLLLADKSMNTRLTTIETMPEELLPQCQWLYDSIKARRMSQSEMMNEFNRRIADSGEPAVSRSGLNRYVMRVRSGEIRRPEAIEQPIIQHSIRIFTPEFRRKLVEKQGASSTALLEATLSALVADKDN